MSVDANLDEVGRTSLRGVHLSGEVIKMRGRSGGERTGRTAEAGGKDGRVGGEQAARPQRPGWAAGCALGVMGNPGGLFSWQWSDLIHEVKSTLASCRWRVK